MLTHVTKMLFARPPKSPFPTNEVVPWDATIPDVGRLLGNHVRLHYCSVIKTFDAFEWRPAPKIRRTGILRFWLIYIQLELLLRSISTARGIFTDSCLSLACRQARIGSGRRIVSDSTCLQPCEQPIWKTTSVGVTCTDSIMDSCPPDSDIFFFTKYSLMRPYLYDKISLCRNYSVLG